MEKKIKLSSRLKQCALMVENKTKIADIGTDHAYLPIYLALENKISDALCCDVRLGPLENAKSNIKKYGLEEKIKTRLSDGLSNVGENEADEIIIAGMGGLLITKILQNCKWKNKIGKKFIFQPMNHERDLRIYLKNNGYEIKCEKAVKCMGKIYTVMKTVYTSIPYEISDESEYIGKLEASDEPALLYIKKQIKDLENRKKGAFIRGEKETENNYTMLIEKLKKYISKENEND